MARRVIATAEVQVNADLSRAEAGLSGLTAAFRSYGRHAERAAQQAEAAFVGMGKRTTQTIRTGFQKMVAGNQELIDAMRRTDLQAAIMAESFQEAQNDLIQLAKSGDTAEERIRNAALAARLMLELTQDIAPSAAAVAAGFHKAEVRARAAAEAAELIAEQTRQAELRAEQLGNAFRDVGHDIDIAMAGGLEQVEDDILDTIRRLKGMGSEFRDVGIIGEQAMERIVAESNRADASVEDVTHAVMRLRGHLEQVEATGKEAFDKAAADARKLASSLDGATRSAGRLDNRMDGVNGVMRRTGGDVRGLIGLLGAAGLGYAFSEVTRFGLSMTQQLDKSKSAFIGLTGSVEGANRLLEKMVVFSRETPYNLGNVTEAAAQLLAVGDGFGVTADNVEQYLTSFGNAISITGGGQEQFTRLVRVFGQMSSTGKVLGQDMNQLAQNLPGYNVWEALAEGAGTSVEELRRLQNIGKLDELLTGDKAVRILVEGINTIPGAAGAMERRMNTLEGAIEKFKETAQLAVSRGLQPFSDTAQDLLGDPVILNAVEDMADAFGSLLSSGLEALGPEIDDLAVAVTNVLNALEAWAPVVAQAADALGDFLNFIAPVIEQVGKMTEALLNAGGGWGKLAAAAGAFLVGGPFGIAAGTVLAVSGAMDLLDAGNERAANSARILAAAINDVNVALAETERTNFSDAQQAQIAAAEDLLETYPDLAQAMVNFGLSTGDLQANLAALRDGTGETSAAFNAMVGSFKGETFWGGAFFTDADPAIGQLENYQEAFGLLTDAVEEETEDLSEILELAGVADLETQERRAAAALELARAQAKAYADQRAAAEEVTDVVVEATQEQIDADEERIDAMKEVLDEQRDLLEESVEAHREWEQGIDDAANSGIISYDELAAEADNSISGMAKMLNTNAADVTAWKGDIVTAALQLETVWGVPAAEAEGFMQLLGQQGLDSATALAPLVDGSEESLAELKGLFDAYQANLEAANISVTDEYGKMSDAPTTLAEKIASGTATVDEILLGLPLMVSDAGKDMETEAGKIDMSDEMEAAGVEAVNGLVASLDAGVDDVRAAMNRLVNATTRSYTQGLNISSPSRVMFDIGEFVVEGLVQGIQSMSDDTYAAGLFAARLLSGGIEDYFRDADDPQEEARKFAEDVAETIIDELIAEQEAVADAAEALAEAAADRLSEAWERVKGRFEVRDIAEAVAEAQAELADAKAELRSAESLAGAGGARAQAAAQRRVDKAERLLAAAQAADDKAERAAEETLTAFRRQTEDTVDALKASQTSELEAIQGRIDAATRNLDPVARAAAEAELEAAKERHAAEMTALERRREDEEDVLRLRLDNENKVRDEAIKAKQDELKAFEKGLADVVKSIAAAVENLPTLRADVGDARRGVQDSFFDQFEQMLDNIDTVDRDLLRSIGSKAGLTQREINDLIGAASASSAASQGAAAASGGVGDLLDILSSGLYTIGADGALGIAAGISSEARAIAEAMQYAVQVAVSSALAALEIGSPSKLTARLIGEPMMEGIAAGLSAAAPSLGYLMNGLLGNVVNAVSLPSTSQLDDGNQYSLQQRLSGPLVTMPGAIIQDATDADLVAQRVVVALAATGVS